MGLCGELAAGKTTFVRLLAAHLSALAPVSSPTFALCHEYPLASGVTLEHWDLYRLSSLPEELSFAASPSTIRLVEWPDRVPQYAAQLDLTLTLSVEITPEGSARELTEYVKSSPRLFSISMPDSSTLEALRNKLDAEGLSR